MPVVIGTGTESPAQRARSELASEIASYVVMPNSSRGLAVCALAINDAIRRLNTKPWEWSRTYQDIVLVAGTADYDMSSDFYSPHSSELLNASNAVIESALSYYDPQTFTDRFFTRSGSGTPRAFTVHNSHDTGQLSFDIAPDSTYVATYPTFRFRYYRRTPYLTVDSDVLDAPSEVESFVVWWGCYYMATRFDPPKALPAKREAEEYWRALVRSEHRQMSTDWSH